MSVAICGKTTVLTDVFDLRGGAGIHCRWMTLHSPKVRFAETATSIEAGGVLSIDLGALASNWKKLASMTVPVECAGVVKADAYGCGLEPVVRTLLATGCRTFFVANFNEGRGVRAIAPSATIYVLNGLVPGAGAKFADAALRPVINSTTELAEWDAFVSANHWRGGAALHVDTGMNRLGVSVDEAVALATRLNSESHGFSLLMSHFACADTPDHPMNDRQSRLFRDIRIMYRGVPSSLANSAGIFLGGTSYCDLVRPGIALYGVNPVPGKSNPMRPVIELKVRILQVRAVKRGDTVGYGATWTAGRAGRIAIIAAGYGDGFLRSGAASKTKPAAEVLIAGRRCPVVGRLSMDVSTVDVTDLPEGGARRGEYATLIGDGMSVDDLAAGLGTINYEVLTSLGRRYHRIYREA
jgi:alanine racemase